MTHIFTLFPKTRILLRIIFKIVTDMRHFIIVCTFVTISIAVTFSASVKSTELQNITLTDFLMHSYLLNYGDFSTDDYNWLQTTIFIGASILVPLIILNMLIAIMGDSYDRVK